MDSININKNRFLIFILWTFIIGVILFITIQAEYHHIEKSEKIIAEIAYKKDLMYRRWVSMQGGIYVHITTHTQSNPHLNFIENRDIVTTNGDSLTLVNPAYMAKQVMKLSLQKYGILGHLTSLNPIDPNNKPDSIEKVALKAFENGDSIFIKKLTINNKEYIKLIKPFITEKTCLKCHAHQGYKEGDIRGALMTLVPISELNELLLTDIRRIIINHIIVWLLGLIGFSILFIKIKKQIDNKIKTDIALKESEEKYRLIAENVSDLIWIYNTSLNKFTYISPSEYQLTGYTDKESIKTSLKEKLEPKSLKKAEEAISDYIQSFIKNPDNKKVYINEFQQKHKNGSYIWIETSSSLRYNTIGEIEIVGITRNIEERKNAEKLLLQSKEQLKTLINTVPDIICFKDGDGRWLIANDADLKLFQLEEVNYIGKTDSELAPYSPFYHDAFMACKKTDETAWKKETISRDIEIISSPHGENYIYDIIKVPIFNSDNSRNSLVVFGRDITEMKNAENALKKSKEHLRLAQEAGKIGSWEWYVETDKLIWSDLTYNIFGIEKTNKPITNKDYFKHVYKKDRQRIIEELETAVKNKKTEHETEYRIIKNEEITWIYETSEIIYNEAGKLYKMIGVAQDITERKKNEQNIISGKKEADKANILKSEFLANMSHEIRTPMNAIIGFSNILQKRLKNENHISFVNNIVKNGNNLLELIDDILDLSKIEAGQLTIQKEPTNLQDIFNEVQYIFSETSNKKQIPININIDKQIPKLLQIDALRIRQVLINLISNALKFTKEGNISITVSINPNSTQKLSKASIIELKNKEESTDLINLKIEVKDSGIGIAEEQLVTIFESFRQGQGQSTRQYGGTGLGLAITKRLVELMNGSISVKSKKGICSIFTIELYNIEKVNSTTEHLIEDNLQTTINKSKILIADDFENNRQIIKIYLENEDIQFLEAENGYQVLDILKTEKPDLILMDISMPKLDGSETTKIIRSTNNKIPIIAVTAHATKRERQNHEHLFDDYIVKPFDEKALKNSLAKFLETKKTNNNNNNETEFLNSILDLQLQKEKTNSFPIKLITIFKEELEPIHYELFKTLSIDKLKTFATKNKEIGQEFNIEVLLKYAQILNTTINNFDLNKINILLNNYNKIIKIIYGK